MKKTVIALSCFLMTTFAYGQDNSTKEFHDYPSHDVGMYFYNCTRNMAQIPGMIQRLGPIENAIWICACTLDKFRATYTHKEMVENGTSPWMRGEAERYGSECYNEFMIEMTQKQNQKSF